MLLQVTHVPANSQTLALLLVCCAALSVQLPRWMAASTSDRSVAQSWLGVQCSLCARCLRDLSAVLSESEPLTVSSPASSVDAAAAAGGAASVGGIAFAEEEFLRIYGCLLLTRLLIATVEQVSDGYHDKSVEDNQQTTEAGHTHFTHFGRCSPHARCTCVTCACLICSLLLLLSLPLVCRSKRRSVLRAAFAPYGVPASCAAAAV